MKLKKVMTKHVTVVSPNTPIQEVAKHMKDIESGFIPVCDGKRVKGMITDRDIVLRAVAPNKQTTQAFAKDIMTPEVIYCYEDDDIQEAAKLMQEKQIRRLIVLDRDKNLVGVVSLGDLYGMLGNGKLASKTLSEISKPDTFVSQKRHIKKKMRQKAWQVAFAAPLAVGLGYYLWSKKTRTPMEKIKRALT